MPIRSILEKHNLFATGTTGAVIVKSAGLKIEKFLPGLMGEQQIGARAAYNGWILLSFSRDPFNC